MRITYILHLYPPTHCAGSEMTAHAILQYLQRQGHEVRAVMMDGPTRKITTAYTHEGIDIYPPSGLAPSVDWSDIVFTHLDYTNTAVQICRQKRKRLVFFAHNDREYPTVANNPEFVYCVYNTAWCRDKLNYINRSIVLHPYVDEKQYKTMEKPDPAGSITLINLNENKGVRTFYRIAMALPDMDFLGVKGSYEMQEVCNLENVAIWNKTSNMPMVYRNTRILCMPSRYESFGRTAMEAACNGIPVIAHPTQGLKEALGDAGIYVDRDDVDGWVAAITDLQDGRKYNAASKAVKARFKFLNFDKQLNDFHQWLISIMR